MAPMTSTRGFTDSIPDNRSGSLNSEAVEPVRPATRGRASTVPAAANQRGPGQSSRAAPRYETETRQTPGGPGGSDISTVQEYQDFLWHQSQSPGPASRGPPKRPASRYQAHHTSRGSPRYCQPPSSTGTSRSRSTPRGRPT